MALNATVLSPGVNSSLGQNCQIIRQSFLVDRSVFSFHLYLLLLARSSQQGMRCLHDTSMHDQLWETTFSSSVPAP